MKLFKKDKSGKQNMGIYEWLVGGARRKHNNRPNNRQKHVGVGLSHVRGVWSKQVGCVKWDKGVKNKMTWCACSK